MKRLQFFLMESLMLDNFFYSPSDLPGNLTGTYNWTLVILSYLVASFASYVALDIARNLRRDTKKNEELVIPHKLWLLMGAFTLGGGIWTMHFIGMQAFDMSMPMTYNFTRTLLSMVFAIAASGLAFLIVTLKENNFTTSFWGGIIIGLGIATMHYVGMSAMLHTEIRYIPSLFFLSIFIAIIASQAALWAIFKSKKMQHRVLINIISAFIMGAAIAGMHYVGMAAALFYKAKHDVSMAGAFQIQSGILSFYIAIMTILIMGIGLILSTYRQYTLALQTQKNRELESKESELSIANFELADKEKKTRAILTTIVDGIVTTDENGLIQTCNPAAEAMFGFEPGKFEGENIYFFISPKAQDTLTLSLDSLAKNDSFHVELMGMRKGGEFFPVELSTSKINLTQGVNYVLTLNNITERKLSEEKLKNLNNQLIGMARQAGMAQVAHSVLHNVGNVLNSVNVSISLIKEKLNKSEMFTLKNMSNILENQHEEWVQLMMKSPKGNFFPQYMRLLVESWEGEFAKNSKELDLLSHKVDHIKHIIRNQQALEVNASIVEEVSLLGLINDAVVMNNLQLKQPGLTININCSDIGNIIVDKVKLLQILVNLIQNAKDAVLASLTKDKEISIKANVTYENRLLIQIIDNGIGILPEYLNQIFSFGFTTKKQGHGFGLNASATIAQELEGRLTAQSEGAGKGATFILELPYRVHAVKP